MPTTRAVVTPSALRWARESAGYEVAEAARRIGVTDERLELAEAGEHLLTMRQAEVAARLYDRPLAALFVPEPPQEEPVEAQFRRLPGTPEPPWPRQLRLLARRVRERQEAAVELYDLLEEDPPWPALQIGFSDDPAVFAGSVRDMLGIPLDEQRQWLDRSGYRPLREWVDKIEAAGVLVMQDGELPVDRMRGFAATHAQVPAVVVNTNDDPRARAFTAVHELGHLLRTRAGQQTGPFTEPWCDELAGHVLMPRTDFERDFRIAVQIARSLLDAVDRVGLTYGVTPLAAAVRASRLRLVAEPEVAEVIEEIRRRGEGAQRQAGGGDYYRTKITRLGPAYVELVFAALDSQALSHSVASGLLREKVNHLPALRERLASRR